MYKIQLKESYFPAQNDAVIRDMTVGELLRNISQSYPNNTALVDISDDGNPLKSWTYKELYETSKTLALALSSRFKFGEKIVIWAPNIPEWIFIEYACAMAGLVIVTANPSFQTKELAYVIDQSKAVGLFLVSEYRGNPMSQIADDAIKENKLLREVIDITDASVLFASKTDEMSLPIVKPNDPAQIQYTSGTTGFPKGAVLTHKNLINNAKIYCDRKKLGVHSVWSNFMPLFHTAGCATGTLGCLSAACKMLLIKRFDAKIFAKLIEEQGVTTCFAVPTMLFNLLESLDHEPRDMSSLEVITTGGAPVPPDLVLRVRKRLGCHLLPAFGQTEHSPMISLNHVDATVKQITETAGQPLAHTEVSIRSLNENIVVPIGKVGEICARSYAVMVSYNENIQATKIAIDKEGWLHTGDLGLMDPKGFIQITGRVKDMIIRGGENHFPAEIEAVLVTHPQVMQVAVIGLPDEKWGEIIAAFFTSKSIIEKELLKTFCRTNLSPQKTPSIWIRVKQFPLTASGKVQKFSIKEQFLDGKYGEVL